MTGVEGDLAAEISATNSEVVRLDAKNTAQDGALAAEIADTNSEVVRLDGADSAMNLRINELEATIIKDVEMANEEFAGAGLQYALNFPVQDDNADLVDVFVNGHRVFIESVAGNQVGLKNPGYIVDAQDAVVFVYQKA